jgi:hypothetical protein
MSWRPDAAQDVDGPFCRAYNAPLLLPASADVSLRAAPSAASPHLLVRLSRHMFSVAASCTVLEGPSKANRHALRARAGVPRHDGRLPIRQVGPGRF